MFKSSLKYFLDTFRYENFTSLVILAMVILILFMPFEVGHINRLLAAEGVLLTCILFLYLLERNKNKKITQEKQQTLKLLEQQVAAIEAAGDAIAIVDKHGNLVFMNKALMALFAINEAERPDFLGHSWLNLYSENGRFDIEENVLPYLEENAYWQGSSPFTRHDGKVIYAEFSLTKLPDGGLIGTARDMSEKEQFGREKKQLEAQLYQAQKMEAIGRLAGGVAHDFNNILAAMNGYAEFLQEDLPAGSQEKQFAENILQAGRQAKDLVDQMLAFSRQKQSSHQQIDLSRIIKEVHSMLKASLPKTIELVCDFQADHSVMEGNESQIAQMIMNVCVNARDAMDGDHGVLELNAVNGNAVDQGWDCINIRDGFLDPEDTPPIIIQEISPLKTRLYLGAIVKDTEYMCLSVKDNGTGMSAVIMENIFEPFFTTKPVDKGTGLGLATALGVVAAHRGALMIDSTLGEGTTFHIFFPVTEFIEQQNIEDIISPEKFIPARILFVEDQENVRMVIENALIRYGYDVDSCENGL